MFIFLETDQGETWAGHDCEEFPVFEGDIVRRCEWDGSSSTVSLIFGSPENLVIGFSGWPQEI